ncbi:MAG: sulfatase-like hydrolase/transferase [Gammaproteobacteria bacterium]|nr:sulfatase-like hydrolase/transferase [Gammaproteobacteria bacterium]
MKKFALHLIALCGFALAQPLYSLLANYPEFFVARGSEPIDLFLLVLILSLVTPLLCLLIVMAAGGYGKNFQENLKYGFVTLFTALFVSQILKAFSFVPGFLLVVLSLAVGVYAAYGYKRWSAVHSVLNIVAPLVIVFPILFLLSPQIARVTFPGSDQSVNEEVEAVPISDAPPVIMVILDEFPLATLVDEQMEIDAVRFPNLAWLAERSYWFRNTTTVSDSTLVSIPSILSGELPILDDERLPTLADYPNNLFTLLANSHQLNIVENGTRLNPFPEDQEVPSTASRIRSLMADISVIYGHVALPVDLAANLPAIDQSWNSFRSVKLSARQYQAFEDFTHELDEPVSLFRDFVASIESSDIPNLYYLHAMLPHKPWQFLPSGKAYSFTPDARAGEVRIESDFGTYPGWGDDQVLIDNNYRRHALQAGYVDSLLGDLFDHLQDAELFERSLIVITSDHGAAFLPDTFSRRVSEQNLADIMWIPLLVKLPYQDQGITSDRNVETIDILPTIADALDLDINWAMDGQSAIDLTLDERANKSILAGTTRLFETQAQSNLRNESVLRKLNTLRSGDWPELYITQEYAALAGRAVAEFEILELDTRVALEGEAFFNNVDLGSSFLLTDIKGEITGQVSGVNYGHIAVAINGVIRTIVGLGSQFEQSQRFAALVPEEAFIGGRNEIDVFFLEDTNGVIRLQRLSRGAQLQYSLIRDDNGAEFLVFPNGQRIPLSSDDIEGYVRADMAQNDSMINLSGWSLDYANTDVPEILVFLNGNLEQVFTPSIRRLDVEEVREQAVGLTPGFGVNFPATNFEVINDADVRVFGINETSAAELVYTENWVFGN